jgi:hypothetical protein
MRRPATFRLEAAAGERPFDGERVVTIVVEQLAPDRALLTVRPLRRKHAATVQLADVARWALWQDARARVDDKRRRRRRTR